MTLAAVPAVLLLMAAHEVAHLGVARLLGYRVAVRLRGRYVKRVSAGVWVPDGGMPPSHDLLIALAAPLLNVALVLPLLALHAVTAATISAALAVATLLPVPHPAQDGWRALRALLRCLTTYKQSSGPGPVAGPPKHAL